MCALETQEVAREHAAEFDDFPNRLVEVVIAEVQGIAGFAALGGKESSFAKQLLQKCGTSSFCLLQERLQVHVRQIQSVAEQNE